MTYAQTLEYLFAQLPMYQRVGAAAYKKDLTNTLALCEALDNPQNKFKSVHVAGTNGKGSVSHMLASVFQQNGFKTGLYTSPHLVDFRERIRINGECVSEDFVIDFVNKIKEPLEKIKPSFFEITVAMAFHYFAQQQVDIAIIETGLGGRLDSTNVVTPEVSIITNIGLDHTDMLGDTLPLIAAEKAGIIIKAGMFRWLLVNVKMLTPTQVFDLNGPGSRNACNHYLPKIWSLHPTRFGRPTCVVITRVHNVRTDDGWRWLH